jgi:hypothetical protein
MGDSLGLCVLDAQISSNDNGPVLEAQLWRLGLDKHEASWDETSMLEFYWETEITDQAGFWIHPAGWVAVRENPEYVKLTGVEHLNRITDGADWIYSFEDYAEAVLFVAPTGMAARATNPSVRARIKNDRLVLLVRRPYGREIGNKNWVGTVTLYQSTEMAEVSRSAEALNRVYLEDAQARQAALDSHVKVIDDSPPVPTLASPPQQKLSPTDRLSALGLLMTCVAVIVAATGQSAVRIGAIVVAAVVAIFSAILMFGPRGRFNRNR